MSNTAPEFREGRHAHDLADGCAHRYRFHSIHPSHFNPKGDFPMTDPDDFATRYALYREVLAKANAENKVALFVALAEAGITHVCVGFDGEGDSGQIDNIAAYKGDELTALPGRKLTIQRLSWGERQPRPEEQPLAEAIECLCYDFLEREHGGWENNDGAFGEFSFDVAGKTVELEFNGRFSDVHTSTHTF
jgi:hypothetical protein